MPTAPILVGFREEYGVHQRQFAEFTIDPDQHTYIIGASGSGKTHLAKNTLIQAIARGDGVGLLDPHGDLAEELLDFIPSHRLRDVCYFNPADVAHPIAWNPLANVPAERRAQTVEDAVAAFRNLFQKGWGYQTEHILRNSIGALIEAENTSLLGIRKMLVDGDYRGQILKQVTDPLVLGFWEQEFATWKEKQRQPAITPILNKLGALFASPLVRNILGQVQNRLNFRELIDNRAIFIASLSKGMIGESASKLFGSLLMTSFTQAALQRADIPREDRVPFYLTVDEFPSFLTDSPEAFTLTLSETRKYKLFLTLLHQFTAQIQDPVLRHALLGNAGNVLVFRVSGHDAKLLEDEFSSETARRSLVSLNRGEVMVRLIENGDRLIPFQGRVAVEPERMHERREEIIRQVRRRFTQPRADVEEKINQFLAPPAPSKKPAKRRARTA